ncbi:hypothetical protein Bca52824_029115 [Brassica carinata]|uniref:Uncharacterized protein n=1 Tax=Brassica carinata TaxID=52824 RepID=A0A8X8AR63_BRACI|nr:hypothetical protein Bca52824_029115 [Brassica carinata]
MSDTSSDLHSRLLQLSDAHRSKRAAKYQPKTSLVPLTKHFISSRTRQPRFNQESRPCLCSSLFFSLLHHQLLSWIPESLLLTAESAFSEISQDYFSDGSNDGKKMRLVIELLPVVTVLTVLDHWSPQVKGEGMITLIHLAKNVSFGLYGDVVLDACCQNIASDDEIWNHVVELSVLLVTKLHPDNPRSLWYERIMNEMLGHLERQPKDKECFRTFLACSFSTYLPSFFQWMHSDDAETVLLVLERVETVVRLTWVRNSPSSMRKERDEIRPLILRILKLLRESKSLQFESVSSRYQEDLNLSTVGEYIYGLALLVPREPLLLSELYGHNS